MSDYLITMDDKRLEDFGLNLEEGQENPSTPNFSHKRMGIPGMPGYWDFGTEIEDKPFRFPIATNGIDRADLQQRLNDLLAFLCDDFGKPRNIKLVYDYELDKFYTVKLAEQVLSDMRKPFTRFVLQFVANDPYKYSNLLGDEIVWGSEVLTFESHYLLGYENDFGGESINVTGNDTLNLSVDGLAVQPVIEIEGSANNLKISCGDYDVELPNFSNETIEVDLKHYVLFKDGQETIADLNKFYLMPGDNEIEITGDNIDIDLRFVFRNKYN